MKNNNVTQGSIELNARQLLCPLPVIKVQNKVAELPAGTLLRVYCTDPGALYDIPCWCRMYGHTVVDSQEQEGEICITLQVGAATMRETAIN